MYAYVPPASGKSPPSSAYTRPPAIVRIPPVIQAARIHRASGSRRAIAAGVRKIPPPIAVPATSSVRSHAPSRRARPTAFDGAEEASGGGDPGVISRIIARTTVYSVGTSPRSRREIFPRLVVPVADREPERFGIGAEDRCPWLPEPRSAGTRSSVS